MKPEAAPRFINSHIVELPSTYDEQTIEFDFEGEQKKLDAKIAKAKQHQAVLAEKQAEAKALNIARKKEELESNLINAARFLKQSLEAGISHEEAKRRLDWADEYQSAADVIRIELEGEIPLEKEAIEPKKSFYEHHNFWVGIICIGLIFAFFFSIPLIKTSDPDAIVFDATAYQKFFLVGSLFSALQLIKLVSLRVFYPVVYEFMNNEVAPDFDFGLSFKTRLKPFEQICVAIFLACWHSLEFILLYSVKF
jgi:hypothetical protein